VIDEDGALEVPQVAVRELMRRGRLPRSAIRNAFHYVTQEQWPGVMIIETIASTARADSTACTYSALAQCKREYCEKSHRFAPPCCSSRDRMGSA
jgi:hypothetical protein